MTARSRSTKPDTNPDTNRSTNPESMNMDTMNMDTTKTAPKMRLLKFGSKTCGACMAMDRAKTLAKLQERNPGLVVVEVLIADARGDSPALGDATNADGIDYKLNYKLSDEYEVTALPTMIMEIEGAGEVFRMEGAASVKQLQELYDEVAAYNTRSALIPW